MVDIHVQVEMYEGRDDTLSGIGRVRSIHGMYKFCKYKFCYIFLISLFLAISSSFSMR